MQKRIKPLLFPVVLILLSFSFSSASAQSVQLGEKLMSKMIRDTIYQIADHVTETDLYYLNAEGDPMAVFIIKARLDKGKLMLEASTPFNKDTFARQTVLKQMKYENNIHQQVLAGINAGFFNTKNGTPVSIEIKDGRTLKEEMPVKRGFAGVLKSEKLIIGKFRLFKKKEDKLEEALGAYPLLIQDGKIIPQKKNTFSLTRHPRTAIGMINKHTVLFVVVDGRQPDYSNGMPLEELALLMKALHARTAINLDGGGSSTLISLDRPTGKWMVRNRPSDGKPRAVANAWILVQAE